MGNKLQFLFIFMNYDQVSNPLEKVIVMMIYRINVKEHTPLPMILYYCITIISTTVKGALKNILF